MRTRYHIQMSLDRLADLERRYESESGEQERQVNNANDAEGNGSRMYALNGLPIVRHDGIGHLTWPAEAIQMCEEDYGKLVRLMDTNFGKSEAKKKLRCVWMDRRCLMRRKAVLRQLQCHWSTSCWLRSRRNARCALITEQYSRAAKGDVCDRTTHYLCAYALHLSGMFE